MSEIRDLRRRGLPEVHRIDPVRPESERPGDDADEPRKRPQDKPDADDENGSAINEYV